MPPSTAQEQESVWDYPRPPRLEASGRRVRVIVDDIVVADSTNAIRVLETTHPPSWYIPRADVRTDLLTQTDHATTCEWKGGATYWTLQTSVDAEPRENIAWSYETPVPDFESIRGHLAFYPERADTCFIDDEQITAEGGPFYGGWLSSDVTMARR